MRHAVLHRGFAIRGAVIASLVPALGGCPSFATFRTARALAPGEVQLTGAVEAEGMTSPRGGGSLSGARPNVGFAARYGVAPGVDLGAKLDPVDGVSMDATLQLVRSRLVDVALGPGLAYFSTPFPVSFGPTTVEDLASSPSYTIIAPSLPVFVGFNVGHGDQVVLGPRVIAWMVQSPETAGRAPWGTELFTGISAGVSLKTVGNVRLMPEADFLFPTAWLGSSSPCSGIACPPIGAGSVIVQGGIGIVVGADELGK